jgi:hypothetical protein
MKKFIVLAFVALLPVQSVLAFCSWGFPPVGKEYQPLNATEAFLSYENGVQTLVLKPEWQGTVSEFGIVYPTPAKPTVTAGPTNLFFELEEATNPWVALPVPMAQEDSGVRTTAKGVQVIEQKQVAEYSVTVLKASNAIDLVRWLKKNGYNYSENDAAKVKYYVDQKDFYFVALKVDASQFEAPTPQPFIREIEASLGIASEPADAKIAAPGWFWGELSPIQISFATDKPQLPMRTLKSAMPEMVFDLYTLGPKAVYIPGVDTIWSNMVDADFLKKVPSLTAYNPKAKWLLRQEVKFVPSNADEDVYLTIAETDTFATVTAGTQARFNPELLKTKTGIIPGARGQVIPTDGKGNAYTFTRTLKVGSVGEDVRALQKILNAEGFVVSDTGVGSPGNETTYFGLKTKAALAKYQNYYRADILTPNGLTAGTGYFGTATMKFMNR